MALRHVSVMNEWLARGPRRSTRYAFSPMIMSVWASRAAPGLVRTSVQVLVVPQTAPRVVARHADRAASHAVGGEARDERRRVAADPHRGVGVVARGGADGVRIVTGRRTSGDAPRPRSR